MDNSGGIEELRGELIEKSHRNNYGSTNPLAAKTITTPFDGIPNKIVMDGSKTQYDMQFLDYKLLTNGMGCIKINLTAKPQDADNTNMSLDGTYRILMKIDDNTIMGVYEKGNAKDYQSRQDRDDYITKKTTIMALQGLSSAVGEAQERYNSAIIELTIPEANNVLKYPVHFLGRLHGE